MTCKKKHGVRLAASCSTEVSTSFAITIRIQSRMFQYVVIEQCGSKILRIATYDFILCLRCIRQEYEIMYYTSSRRSFLNKPCIMVNIVSKAPSSTESVASALCQP